MKMSRPADEGTLRDAIATEISSSDLADADERREIQGTLD